MTDRERQLIIQCRIWKHRCAHYREKAERERRRRIKAQQVALRYRQCVTGSYNLCRNLGLKSMAQIYLDALEKTDILFDQTVEEYDEN